MIRSRSESGLTVSTTTRVIDYVESKYVFASTARRRSRSNLHRYATQIAVCARLLRAVTQDGQYTSCRNSSSCWGDETPMYIYLDPKTSAPSYINGTRTERIQIEEVMLGCFTIKTIGGQTLEAVLGQERRGHK